MARPPQADGMVKYDELGDTGRLVGDVAKQQVLQALCDLGALQVLSVEEPRPLVLAKPKHVVPSRFPER